jgi:8-oxo-dGTP pyrophosphatase MutT (NUDIX family)
VAGSVDVVGERPEEALKREIVEEIGYRMDTCTHIRDFYVSPGGVSEIISLYYVEVSEKVSDGGGIGDENIETIEVDYLGVMGTLFFEPKDGVITPPYRLIDAKSIIAVNYVETNRMLKDMANVITQVRMNGF